MFDGYSNQIGDRYFEWIHLSCMQICMMDMPIMYAIVCRNSLHWLWFSVNLGKYKIISLLNFALKSEKKWEKRFLVTYLLTYLLLLLSKYGGRENSSSNLSIVFMVFCIRNNLMPEDVVAVCPGIQLLTTSGEMYRNIGNHIGWIYQSYRWQIFWVDTLVMYANMHDGYDNHICNCL